MIVASTGIIASIVYAIYGKFKLTRNGCLCFNIAPLTAFHMSFVFVFFIGFDRLLAVLFPIWHLSLAIKSYLSLLCTIAVAVGILLSYFAVIFSSDTDATMLRCSIADFWNGVYGDILLRICLTLTAAAVFCYILIFIRFYFRKNAPTTQNNVKKLEGVNKSIIIILLIIIFGWICTSISRQLIPKIFPNPYPAGYIVMNCFDLVLTFVGCANTFVLYNCRLEKITAFGYF
uniref:G-protein coupled receptors family 1 profile domain-containing protein n=1 Tax=Meloidogyne incognita TaxID=6306 RepID=A0A914L3D7_MELIC